MSMRTKLPDDPNCTCHLEPGFMATDENEVRDAECELVATCDEPRYTSLVAWALDAAGDDQAICIKHSKTRTIVNVLRERVLEFHRVFEHPVGDRPRTLDDARTRLRISLIAEECGELLEALGVPSATVDGIRGWTDHVVNRATLNKPDMAGIVDGCEDLKYVVEGTLVEMGVDSGPMGREVHRSNMSKLGLDGRPIKRADGKSVKGPNYSPPDIATELERQGWGR
jgi:predicted HAD superfamily Cof-like phosphohydrolase